MTRKRQNRVIILVVTGLLVLIGLALAAKLSGIGWALNFYEFLRDTSLLIVTVIAAYMAHIYQKRSTFLQNLREQWHDIVSTKGELLYYAHLDKPTVEDYLISARQLSECIDNMRIVYSNVGETAKCVGLYPYAPLHQMRMVMESLDPRTATPTAEERYEARGKIWDAFLAIREHFLDEFDLEEPTKPILIYRMKRRKRDGATKEALERKDRQAKLAENHRRDS